MTVKSRLGVPEVPQYHENAEHFQDTENPKGFSSALVCGCAQMTKYKIEFDREVCIGALACTAVAE
ncbi:MAG: hypothetical protein AABX74_06200, partial [Nanoarchaeota archaeon]